MREIHMVTPIGYGILVTLMLAQFTGTTFLIRLFRRHCEFYKRARITDGVVSRIENYRDTDGRSYVCTYRYYVDGVAYEIDEEVFRSWFRPRRGQKITIYYAPTTPERGRLAHPALGPLFLGGALACFAVGTFIAVLLIRNV